MRCHVNKGRAEDSGNIPVVLVEILFNMCITVGFMKSVVVSQGD